MKYNPKQYTPGLGKMLKSSEFARVVLEAAEDGADAARAAAPYDDGELQGSIHVEYMGDSGGPKGDRVEARIVADADHAVAVNFGTKYQDGQNFMQAAIDAIHDPKVGE